MSAISKVVPPRSPHPRPSSVSVILVMRNGMPHIIEQLEALIAQEIDVPWELVVAVNGSSDATLAEVARFEGRFPRLVVVDASARPSPQYARRCGVEAATGEFVAFCDHDDVVAPGWLQALTDASVDFDALGGALDLASLNDRRLVDAWCLQGSTTGLVKAFNGVTYPMGANWAIWRNVYAEIDEPDRDLPNRVGGEDVLTGCRLRRASRSLGFAPRARVAHRLSDSTAETFRQLRSYGLSLSMIAARYPDISGTEPPLSHTAFHCLVLTARLVKARLEGKKIHWSRCSLAIELGHFEGGLRMRFGCWGTSWRRP
jgi:glycosyltransferase involved in cell wall biosynthesis